MKFPISRRKQEHLEKVATFQERLENINGLTDQTEKLLELLKLQKELQTYTAHREQNRDVTGTLIAAPGAAALTGSFVLAITGLPFAPVLAFCGAPLYIYGLHYATLPASEKALMKFAENVQTATHEIVEKESLTTLAISPHLQAALRSSPALKARFDEAAQVRIYREALLPEPREKSPQLPAPKKGEDGFRL